jgi:hypothetical protein
MRHGRMPSTTADRDFDNSCGCQEGSGAGTETAHGKLRPYVKTENPLDGWVLKGTFISHPLTTCSTFFRGLKYQLHSSVYVSLAFLQQPCCTQQHGRMAVVTAGVHSARNLTAKRNIRAKRYARTIAITERGQDASLRQRMLVRDS